MFGQCYLLHINNNKSTLKPTQFYCIKWEDKLIACITLSIGQILQNKCWLPNIRCLILTQSYVTKSDIFTNCKSYEMKLIPSKLISKEMIWSDIIWNRISAPYMYPWLYCTSSNFIHNISWMENFTTPQPFFRSIVIMQILCFFCTLNHSSFIQNSFDP